MKIINIDGIDHHFNDDRTIDYTTGKLTGRGKRRLAGKLTVNLITMYDYIGYKKARDYWESCDMY